MSPGRAHVSSCRCNGQLTSLSYFLPIGARESSTLLHCQHYGFGNGASCAVLVRLHGLMTLTSYSPITLIRPL